MTSERSRAGRAWARRAVTFAVVVAPLALGIAACGAGSSVPKVASVGSTTTTGGSPTANGSRPRQAGLTKMLESARCMRAHGIADFPDPSSDGSISLHVQPGSDLNPHSPQFQAAQSACKLDFTGANMTPAQEAAANARALNYSQCMRSNGIADFPDPNGQGTLTIDMGTGDLDSNSAKFQAAEKACQSLDTGFNTDENDLSPPPGAG
jgi:hypothetical protein